MYLLLCPLRTVWAKRAVHRGPNRTNDVVQRGTGTTEYSCHSVYCLVYSGQYRPVPTVQACLEATDTVYCTVIYSFYLLVPPWTPTPEALTLRYPSVQRGTTLDNDGVHCLVGYAQYRQVRPVGTVV